MKDPTARTALRNVDGRNRFASLHVPVVDHLERVWLDKATLQTLTNMVRMFTDDDGEVHIRFNEKTLALLEQGEGQASNEGHQS